LCLLRDVPPGLLRDMFAVLATVPDATMPYTPSVGHELPAAGTSADPPVLTLGWFGAEHSDPGRLDGSAKHQGILWVIRRRRWSGEKGWKNVSRRYRSIGWRKG